MGTWGAGNFENDGALDYTGEVLDGLIARIQQCLDDEELSALDEDGEAVVVPGVQMISLLCEHCNAAPPEAAIITAWKDQYLAIFDEQIDSLAPQPSHKEERRQIIEETFNKLEAQARVFWQKPESSDT